MNAFFYGQPPFTAWNIHHVTTLLVFALIGFVVIYLGKNKLTDKQKYWLGNGLAIFVTGTIVVWTGLEIYFGRFTLSTHPPIAICNFVGMLVPIMMISRSYLLYEIFYFWIMAGTMQANLTPDLSFGYPHYCFFKYWIVHSGLIVVILYATIVYKQRPYIKSLFKSLAFLAVYFLFTLLVNYLTSANHMYLNAKPKSASLLDYMGPWPWYIFVVILIVIPLFFLVYMPFVIKDLIKKSRRN